MIKKIFIFFLMILNLAIFANNSPRLLIKIPTRSRPEQFFKMLDLYYARLSGEIQCKFLISCDVDDEAMNCTDVHAKFKNYKNLFVHFSKSNSKVEAYNADIEYHLDFDILLVTSDDMEPVADGYDKIIAQNMISYFPQFDGVLNFHDGYWGAEINTLPIIGKKFYNMFDYVYHPDYKSLWCDTELTEVSRILNKEKYIDQVIIKHKHPYHTNGVVMDELYSRNDKWYQTDMATFVNRKNNSFFINDINRKPDWSILICTLDERKETFNRIYEKINKQVYDLGLENKIEILSFCDNREHSIGYKRNELIKKSSGKYVCFIDDDDDINDTYIKLIYEKLKNNPDCLSLTGVVTFNGTCPCKFFHSIKYKSWFNIENDFFRPPNHLNVIKRDIANRFHFPEINFAEDKEWSMSIAESNLLQKEEVIDEPLYFYLYKTK